MLAIQRLIDLGYIVGRTVESVAADPQVLADAVARFQDFYGLKSDGVLGRVTERVLEQRMLCGCGNRDIEARGQVCKWPMRDIAYFVKRTPNGLTPEAALRAIDRGMHSWNAVFDVRLFRVDSEAQANIVIDVARGSRAGFDGPSGTLAYAYFPCGANRQSKFQQFYDLDEQFVESGPGMGILLENVVAHETGHSLGFEHIPSSRGTALMNPIYSRSIKSATPIDIATYGSFYGLAKSPAPTPTPEPTPTPGGKKLVIEIPNYGGGDIAINGQKVRV